MTDFLRPRLKPNVRCDIVAGEAVVLDLAGIGFVSHASVFLDIIPLLDGQNDLTAILQQLSDKHEPMAVFRALDQLREEEMLTNGPMDGMPSPQEAFWQMQGVELGDATRHLEQTSVSIGTFGASHQIAFQTLTKLLQENGVRFDVSAIISLACASDYRATGLATYCSEARAAGRPVLMIRPAGDRFFLGPYFDPKEKGCLDCLATRSNAHRKLERFLDQRQERRETFSTGEATLPSLEAAAAGLIATEIARLIVSDDLASLHGRIIERDLLSGNTTNHALIADPQCKTCGSQNGTCDRAEFVLSPKAHGFRDDGGFRFQPPDKTVELLSPLISSVSGIIGYFGRVDSAVDDPEVMHCYVADHVFTPMNGRIDRLREGREGRAAGKGRTDIQAQASALCEAVERYSGVFQGHEQQVTARAAELDGAAILPNELQNFSTRQIESRTADDADAGGAAWIADHFDADAEIEWTAMWSLTHNRARYLPTANCYYGYGLLRGLDYARADSNGCAAGNTLEEAVLQGFLELVERDSVAIWWYNRLRRPGVDLSSFADTYIDRLVEHYKDRGREIWLLDLTADFDIPAFAAISRQIGAAKERLLFGYGCHLDARLAASRALTEVNQALAMFTGNKSDHDAAAQLDGEGFSWWPIASVAEHPYLLPDPQVPIRNASDFRLHPSNDLYDDVMDCVARAQAKGLEVLVLDQSRADTGLKVVRVAVPGLRHFWPRLGPGRLYDVPVKMGWLDAPLDEQALNPAHFFL
ncbi:MAG: TOMM precursor leader peptide-binding protein [Pseudomonadota bacterium]